MVRLSPVKAKPRTVSLIRSPRPPPTLELDTVLEERSDPEQTTLSQVRISIYIIVGYDNNNRYKSFLRNDIVLLWLDSNPRP